MTMDTSIAAEHPLVSIGVPVYNGGDLLTEALESALSQDYPNLEIVIADNASTDETEAICRRFAERDPRVRYIRNATNIGPLPNWRLVLDESRGTYFTWLAHDDVLSDPGYLRAVVGFLEQHPDVMGCTTALEVLNHQAVGVPPVVTFPEIAPEQPWPEARKQFFRWPQAPAYMTAIYGVFRRDVLRRAPVAPRMYRGKPNVICWEMPTLTTVCGYGRIVALPECLRAYRAALTAGQGQRISLESSPFDLMLLGLGLKWDLLRAAWRAPLPLRERGTLLRVALDNLLRANFSQPLDFRWVIRQRERELATLWQTAKERDRLIQSLQAEIGKRLEIARAQGRTDGLAGEPAGLGAPLPARHPDDPVKRGNPVLDFFRRPSAALVERSRELNEEVTALRRHCEAQLQTIEWLHARAAAVLEIINAPPA